MPDVKSSSVSNPPRQLSKEESNQNCDDKVGFSTFAFAALSFIVLGLAVYVIGTIDIYIAGGCAFLGLLSLHMISRKTDGMEQIGRRRGIAPIMLVAIAPALSSVALALLGYLGPPVEALFRILMATGFSIAIFVSAFPIALAIKFKILERKTMGRRNQQPLVSILVPAYNEEDVISRTLESLMNLNYDKKEIIVIDDGSTDRTGIIASWYKQYGVKVLRKPNGGKASALNYGMLFARGDIMITIDSDSMVTREGVKEMVAVMTSDPNIAAVAGNIRVLNAKSFLTRIQELEYIMAINTIRRAFAIFGVVMVVPGAFGAFRKKQVMSVGAYDRDTLTEDFDLTIKLLKTQGVVGSSSRGIAYTEVPSTWKALYKQRLRWNTGTFQTIYKHRDAIWNRRFNLVHSFVFPMMMLSVFNPIASFVALGAGIILAMTGGLFLFLKMETLFLLVQLFVSLVAISIDREDYRLAVYSPFFMILYKQFLDFTSVVSAFRALFLKKKQWHKIERTGGTTAIRVKR